MAPEFKQGFTEINGILQTLGPYLLGLAVISFFIWIFRK